MKLRYRWRNPRFAAPDRKILSQIARAAAKAAGLDADGDWVLEVTFVGDTAMTRLNRDIVGHVGTTDVITISYFDDPENVFPGDTAVELFINADFAGREGGNRGTGYAYEMTIYLTHGLLHSSGEDDLTPAPRKKMRRREKEVMKYIAETVAGWQNAWGAGKKKDEN